MIAPLLTHRLRENEIGYNIRIVEEGRALQADLDESRAHSGQDVFHMAFVDVPHYVLFILAFHKEFHQTVVLQHSDALFQRMDVDDYLGVKPVFFAICRGFLHIWFTPQSNL